MLCLRFAFLHRYLVCVFLFLLFIFVSVLLFVLVSIFVFFLMIRRPPRSTLDRSSAASDVYKRQLLHDQWYDQNSISSWVLFHKDLSQLYFFWSPQIYTCLLYTSPSPRDRTRSRMPSSAWKKKKKDSNNTSYHQTHKNHTVLQHHTTSRS